MASGRLGRYASENPDRTPSSTSPFHSIRSCHWRKPHRVTEQLTLKLHEVVPGSDAVVRAEPCLLATAPLIEKIRSEATMSQR